MSGRNSRRRDDRSPVAVCLNPANGFCANTIVIYRSTFVIKLRLRRTGAKKRPSYRIVAAEHSAPRDGRFIEIIGHYDPLTEPATVKVNEERARHWLSVGAQPSDTVAGLLKRAGVIESDAPVTPAVEVQA